MVKLNRKAYPFYLITLLYFILGFVNISFAFLALICMMIPFILVVKTGKKPWCSKYCPRADYLKLFRPFSRGFKSPLWLNTDRTRKIVLQFFCINLFFAIMSTFMAAQGRIEPIHNVRFLMAFQIPGSLPQLWTPIILPDWTVHLAYRFYSIMFSSTVVGSIMGLFYKPRTWCAVCPVNTVSSFLITESPSYRS